MPIKRATKQISALPPPADAVLRHIEHRSLIHATRWNGADLPAQSNPERKAGPIPLVNRHQLDPLARAVVEKPGTVSDLIVLRLSSDLMAAAERAMRIRSMPPPRRRYHASFRAMTLAHKNGVVAGLRKYLNDIAAS